MTISGERLTLRILTPDDIAGELGEHYVAWMNDSDITQFLESRWQTHTMESVRAFVAAMHASQRDFQFGMFLNESGSQTGSQTGLHIGNIKIGSIDQNHQRGDVGLLIGDKAAHGKGYATEAITLATRIGFEELNLRKLTAGMYAPNVGSYKAFIKAGWSDAGVQKAHYFYNGGYVDGLLVEKCRETP
jgi:[ribosomal protein S5]-alanine N-acetyltransferase